VSTINSWFKPIAYFTVLITWLQGAYLVGVDSLGVDVRVSSGAEVKTHRFPFKIQVRIVCFNRMYIIPD